ncbi:MAG: putative bifunctional diguanylate cyclase/phosphodiesterase [Lysobacteraceae bacterium]
MRPRWPFARWRLQDRLLALVVGLVLGLQVLVLVAVGVSVNRAVEIQIGHELDVGHRVWTHFVEARGEALLDAAGVLAADFGFRSAAASGDLPTMRSALDNHARRAGAARAILHAPDGDVLAEGGGGGGPGAWPPMDAWLAGADPLRGRQGLFRVGEGIYQVATVPVMAPTRIAWVSMAHPLDGDSLEAFATLSGLRAEVRADGEGAGRPSRMAGEVKAGDGPVLLSSGPGEVVAQVFALELAGGTGAHGELVLLASADAVLAPYARMRWWIIGISFAGALVALVVAVAVGRSVGRPVAALAGVARRVADGDFAGRVDPPAGGEIGDLARAFNHMQEGLAQREARIVHQARHDGLTGLPNRAAAAAGLAGMLDQGVPCAALMVDLDRFKEVNDTLGHAFGDALLREVAGRLSGCAGAHDIVARLGGDEFLLLLRDADAGRAQSVAAQAAARLREPMQIQGTQVAVEASVGVALAPLHADSPEALVRRADMAMYEAKQRRQGVCTYQPGREESHLRRIGLMRDLRGAAERGEFALVFQPKLSLASGRVCHAEALLRWDHPVSGAVPPDEFIPLAESAGLVGGISAFVIDRALAACAQWQAGGLEIAVAINLSAMDLLDDGLPERIDAALGRHGLAARALIVEVTESAVMRDIDYAARVLQRLREGGVRVAIDDFGTGHSSLSQLKRLPVDELKIDKSFVMRLEAGGDDEIIVRSTIEIGHNMGLSVIAEGVETQAGLDLLRRHRCDMVQGYLFSRPLPLDAFRDWCTARNAAPQPRSQEAGQGV